MQNQYYVKNMAHTYNHDYFVTFLAIPEKTDFHKVIKERRKVREMEELLQSGKMNNWFCAKIVVTLIGTDDSEEIEIPQCTNKSYEEFLADKRRLNSLIKQATEKLDKRVKNSNYFGFECSAA